jgi:elongation factor Ts
MMDAKKALEDAGGDFDQAFILLRERGQAKVAKRAEREATEGAIGSYLHVQNDRPVIGVLVELSCETDFVAKSPDFKGLADDLAMHVSWWNPQWITREAVDSDALARERELIARQASGDGKPPEVVDRIVGGKLEAWFAENVLYDQRFVNAEKFDGTVGEMVTALASKMGENISVRRMTRMAVGG